MDNDRFMSPTHDDVFFSQVSLDRYELMWNGPTQDSFGNMTGPVFNRTMLKNSVQFVEPNGGNKEIKYFLSHMIKQLPADRDYTPFLESYKKILQKGVK